MILKLQRPIDVLNKAYRNEKVSRNNIEAFKTNLSTLLSKINPKESEEHHKKPVADFLKNTWYKDQYEINTKGRTDFVIHNGKTTNDTVGVIIEVKSPANQQEMISEEKPNRKALHELILYYFHERVDLNQVEIKNLVITNIWEWYVFDEAWFEQHIFRSRLKKEYDTYKISGKDTKFFFDSIAKPFLDALEEPMLCTHFDIREYEKKISSEHKQDDEDLIDLFKILSPAHLLSEPFANDSNTLDKKFYEELLHIIGLEEKPVGGKKLIQRKDTPDYASLLESTMVKLADKDCLRKITGISDYGSATNDQLFNVALELCITWINRVLFVKLLEGQMFTYHKGDKDYLFLNIKTIRDFGQLNNLFFQVLAEPSETRHEHLRDKFSKIPYLNSSLFERTQLEKETIEISELDNMQELGIYAGSVLKKDDRKKNINHLITLQYLFDFLDAYDFSSDGSKRIQEENKNLINASVLGLIFEKINGYKDGSFFTPGFITMYICRETIRRAVLQKFKEVKGWECENITPQLYNKIGDSQIEANNIINSLKICDPAVGSGHFLVSALNEVIAIKSELHILLDRQGKTLRGYQVEVVNDALVITGEEGKLLDYNPKNRESQRIQEALFHEKETIIENCLFGVDINPNSVKICRLRLWIELLKNAYYTASSNYTELETLPNIDINIKCGNSLISRFALDADLSKALKNSKWNVDSYKIAVQTYRKSENKYEKREMEELIESIKSNFRTEIRDNDPKVKKLQKLNTEYYLKYQADNLFNAHLTKAQIKDKEEFEKEITQLDTEIQEIKSSKIYDNAFEWRFEFPEVLDSYGRFIGFDIVMGNPPYLQAKDGQLSESEKKYYYAYYKTTEYQINTFGLFIEKSVSLLKETQFLALIIPNYWISTKYDKKLRKFIFQKNYVIEVLNVYAIFEEAVVDTMILMGSKGESSKEQTTHIKAINNKLRSIKERLEAVRDSIWNYMHAVIINKEAEDVVISFQQGVSLQANKLLGDYFTLKFGAKLYEVGKGVPAQTKADAKNAIYQANEKVSKEYKRLLGAKNIKHFHVVWNNTWVKYGENLAAPRSKEIFNGDRILLQRIVSRKNLDAAFIQEEFICNTDVITLIPQSVKINCKLFVAIINSQLCSKYIRSTNVNLDRNVFPKINTNTLESFPVPDYDNINPTLKKKICTLVDKISKLKNISPVADTTLLEKEIDHLVYQLYGLTDEEIKIVEGT